MPHIPGHNRPFTSFLTQGMRNTNRNISNFNRPGGQTNYLTPPNQFNNPNIYNPMSRGFTQGGFAGNLNYGDMNNPPIEDQPGLDPGFDVNNDGVVDINDITMYSSDEFWQEQQEGFWTEGTEGYFGPTTYGNQGGFEDYSDWGLDLAGQYGYNPNAQIDNPETTSFEEMMQNYASSWIAPNPNDGPHEPATIGEEFEGLFTGDYPPTPPWGSDDFSQENLQQWINTMNPDDLEIFQQYWHGTYGQAYDENPWTVGANPMGWQDYLGQSADFQSEQDYAGQSLEDLFEQQAPWEIQGDWVAPTEAYYTDPVASQAFEGGYGIGGPQEGFLDNLMNYITQPQLGPQQFAGGGGQGGQAAKQLYYPGTSGGFAGVGSGIGGGKSLQELLGGM